MHKHTHKERETEIYEVRQDDHVPEGEEKDLLTIYTRLQENYTWFTQEHSPAQDTHPMGSILYL